MVKASVAAVVLVAAVSCFGQFSIGGTATICGTATTPGIITGLVIPSTYFGNQKHLGSSPWVGVPFGSYRLSSWENLVNWANVQPTDPGSGTTDLSGIGKKIEEAHSNGMDDMAWNFADVPDWIASNPLNGLCNPNQGCTVPNDVCTDTWATFKGTWTAGSYSAGDGVTTSSRNNCGTTKDQPCNDQVWHALVNTSGTPGSSGDWATACTNTSGTDAKLKKFVTDVMNAITPTTGSPFKNFVKTYEFWWGPNTGQWIGTNSQLRKMQSDAWTIIHAACPDCKVTSPTPEGNAAASWLLTYLTEGNNAAASYTDVVGIHCYANDGNAQSPSPSAEAVTTLLDTLVNGLAGTPYQNKSVYDMESSWGTQMSPAIPDGDDRAGFLAKHLLLMWPRVSRSYWWGWDEDASGRLWKSTSVGECTTTWGPGGYMCTAGKAYSTLYSWIVGKSMTGVCSQVSNIWTCPFSDGSLVIWNAGQTSFSVDVTNGSTTVNCHSGACFASAAPTPGTYVYIATTGGNPVIPGKVLSVDSSNTFLTLDPSTPYTGTTGTSRTMTWHSYTVPYSLTTSYAKSTDLYGNVTNLNGVRTVNVGYMPVLLSN